jgi:hypothetical protein
MAFKFRRQRGAQHLKVHMLEVNAAVVQEECKSSGSSSPLCLCTLKEGSGVRLKTQLSWFCVYCGDSDYMFQPCSAIFRSQCRTQRRKNTIVCAQALYDYQRDLVVILYCDMSYFLRWDFCRYYGLLGLYMYSW